LAYANLIFFLYLEIDNRSILEFLKTYGIFFNPNAGDGKSEETANLLKEELSKIQIESKFLTAPSEELAIEKIMTSLETLDGMVAIGGDGTLNCVGTAFIRSQKSIPLGIIPGGTINNFAKRWHIPLNVEEAIKVIIEGKTRKISIGKCHDRAIISSFTFGRLADMSNDVRQSEKQKFLFNTLQNRKRNKRIENLGSFSDNHFLCWWVTLYDSRC
jgi:diacylglycerol kinase family enzyme